MASKIDIAIVLKNTKLMVSIYCMSYPTKSIPLFYEQVKIWN